MSLLLMKLRKSILAIVLLLNFSGVVIAEEKVTVQGVTDYLQRFVKTPHPMGSKAQLQYAQELKKQFKEWGWEIKEQAFKAQIPNLDSTAFGGKNPKANKTKEVQAENVIAISKGENRCLVLIGGHYDTKPYQHIQFVGANDGGSSTAMMLEMGRAITHIRKAENKASHASKLMDCSIAMVFFDGEEAVLPDWNDGQQILGKQDNTYGSRHFVKDIKKSFDGLNYQNLPIKLVMVVDMVGHKQQNLMISAGSNFAYAQKLLAQNKNHIKIGLQNNPMEDDHIPFAQLGIPFLHIIDFTNIQEWHTEKDTTAIISYQNIAHLGNMLLDFLKNSAPN